MIERSDVVEEPVPSASTWRRMIERSDVVEEPVPDASTWRRMIERSDVVEEPVPDASTWSVSPPVQAKSSSLLLSEDIKPLNKKRILNEDIVEKAGARGFQDLPPEIIGKIMSYLETTDKKKMRCVSKWCFNVVSNASKELKSLFGTYSLKWIGRKNYCEISKVLTKAMEGVPAVKLDLQFHYDFTEYDENGEEDELVTSKQLDEMLTTFSLNIASLRISLSDEGECDNTKLLLQPHLELTNIKRIDLQFTEVETDLQKDTCEAILARYGDKLEHLGVMDLEIPDNNILQVPRLPKLQSLSIHCDDNVNAIVHAFANSVNKENINHLAIQSYRIHIGNLDNLIFPKLKSLELIGEDCGETALPLIKCHKDTITKLILDHVFVNMKHLHFDVAIPYLQCLELHGIHTKSSLSLIEKNKDTLVELRLKGGSPYVRDSDSFPVVEMPRLKRLYLMHYDDDEELNRINAFGRNITELWLFDFDTYSKEDKYIKQSTRRLNKLKIKAKRLKKTTYSFKLKSRFKKSSKNLK